MNKINKIRNTLLSGYRFIGLILFMLIWGCSQDRQPVSYVNPFICTEGDHGQWHPSALVPFGLVKLGPDTYPSSLESSGNWGLAHSGYNYADTVIRGFSHFRRGSAGGKMSVGKFSFMPFTAASPGKEWVACPVAQMDKKSEKASPGFYSVRLSREHILAELTAATRTGFHRYTFPAGKEAKILIYNGNNGLEDNLSFQLVNNTSIEGMLDMSGGIFFTLEFSCPVQRTEVWDGDQFAETGSREINQAIVCSFGDTGGKPLLVKAGFSLTGPEAARQNMETECPDWNFEKIRKQASKQWNDQLGRMKVESPDNTDKTIFYTALYHTCFLPVNQTDVAGTYKGYDRQIHHAEGYTHYDGYAFWDSFRNKYPLYSLFLPGVYSDIASSLRDTYEQSDNRAPFPDCNHAPHGYGFEVYGKNGFQTYSNCRHEHMLMVVTDAWVKGLFHSNLDMKELYPFLKQEALLQMPERYDSIGYIPARPDQTGEYCWNSWCVTQVARALGYRQDEAWFMKRSAYWRNTWDPSIRFFRARAADGSWLDFPEDPTVNREKYTYEGTKWQWRWNLLHDPQAMIGLFGGNENFVEVLNSFFENNLYTAGNQIDLHAPFLFNFAGAAWLTQKWTHKILKEPMMQLYGTHDFFKQPVFDRIYKATPDGYLEEMDDDYGCMASWYVLASSGLYQVCPGNPVYQISSPLFDRVTITLDQHFYPGKTFTITAKNRSDEQIYIQSASLNGKKLDRMWITHKEITQGGELVLVMGKYPKKK